MVVIGKFRAGDKIHVPAGDGGEEIFSSETHLPCSAATDEEGAVGAVNGIGDAEELTIILGEYSRQGLFLLHNLLYEEVGIAALPGLFRRPVYGDRPLGYGVAFGDGEH